MYTRCPFCSNNYKVRVPKGGDGSEVVIRKHNWKIWTTAGQLSFLKKEKCPGSGYPLDVSEAFEEGQNHERTGRR